ncbi:MAG: DUF2853 family protein [Flavobacteriaceae bacterium]|jgi:hypothetical protein
MSKRDELITLYAKELKEKCNVTADMNLLTKVTIGCGPSIYNRDSATVSCTNQDELDTVKNNYLIKKLGLKNGPELDKAIAKICEKLGSSNKNKYRAIFYYLLCKEFGKESVYK